MSRIIIMYYGTSCPGTWQECDGQDGRPDLRGVFPMGVNTTYVESRADIASGLNDRISTYEHDHTIDSHTHDGTLNIGSSTSANASTNPGPDDIGLNHIEGSVGPLTSTVASSETVSDSSNMPMYLGVLFCTKEI